MAKSNQPRYMQLEILTMTKLTVEDHEVTQGWRTGHITIPRTVHQSIKIRSVMFLTLGCCAFFLSGYYVSLWGNLTQRGVMKASVKVSRKVLSAEETLEERLFMARMEKRMQERKRNLTIACRDLGKSKSIL